MSSASGERESIEHRRRQRLAQRRKAVGLSQERLAETIGVDRSTVVRWERADTDPQPWHRPRLARALRLSVEELAGLLTDVSEAPSRPDERLDYVLKHPGSVDLVTVAFLRNQIQRLDEKYPSLPSTLLLAEAGQFHGQAAFLRGHAGSERVRRELLAAEIESATLMGQLVWDASQRRDHATTNSYFDQAVSAARHIRDVVAEAYAELRKSYVALYSANNPALGLALADHAAATARYGSRVITGLALLHVGEAHAMLGEGRRCDQALRAAETHFATITSDDPASVLFCPSQHDRIRGSCLLALHKPGKAELVLDKARQTLNERSKSAALILGNLALASIRQRNIDEGAARLHETIDLVERTRGGGGLNVAFTAARELSPWRGERAVEEVNDRLFGLMASGRG